MICSGGGQKWFCSGAEESAGPKEKERTSQQGTMFLCWPGADEREEITRTSEIQESEANDRCTGRESGLNHVDLTDPG